MEPRELYNKILEAKKEGDNFELANLAEKIMFKVTDNPFSEEDPRRDLFFNASMSFGRWQKGGIDCRRSRVKVYEYWAKIAELDMPNPFEKPKIKPTKKVKQEEPSHILGVLPEDPNKISYNVVEENSQTKEPEVTDPKKGFFSKHKKR